MSALNEQLMLVRQRAAMRHHQFHRQKQQGKPIEFVSGDIIDLELERDAKHNFQGDRDLLYYTLCFIPNDNEGFRFLLNIRRVSKLFYALIEYERPEIWNHRCYELDFQGYSTKPLASFVKAVSKLYHDMYFVKGYNLSNMVLRNIQVTADVFSLHPVHGISLKQCRVSPDVITIVNETSVNELRFDDCTTTVDGSVPEPLLKIRAVGQDNNQSSENSAVVQKQDTTDDQSSSTDMDHLKRVILNSGNSNNYIADRMSIRSDPTKKPEGVHFVVECDSTDSLLTRYNQGVELCTGVRHYVGTSTIGSEEQLLENNDPFSLKSKGWFMHATSDDTQFIYTRDIGEKYHREKRLVAELMDSYKDLLNRDMTSSCTRKRIWNMTYPVERLLYSMQHPSSIGIKRLQEMAKRMVSNIEPEHKVDESTYTTQHEARRLMTNIVQKHRQLCKSSAIDYNHMLDTIRSLRGVQWSSIENECLRMKKEVEDAEIRYKRKRHVDQVTQLSQSSCKRPRLSHQTNRTGQKVRCV